jgi:16S rRNA (guanine527-N7)-methyltransferase
MHPDEDGYGPDELARELGLSAAEIADLQSFRALLAESSSQMNLVGPSALAQFWRRHVLDSGQLLDLAPEALRWADLGAGAGFPGIVLAIRLKGREGAVVHLVESQQKRCRFLQQVVDALQLPAQVHWARAEAMAAPVVDIVTARACAPLSRLFGYALPFTGKGARGLFLKGRSAEAEIAEARKAWRFRAAVLPSRSDPADAEGGGRIVSIEGLSRG